MNCLSSLEYFLVGILTGFVLSDSPGKSVGYSMLLQATDSLFVVSLDPKTNGFKAPLNLSVTDLCFFNKSNPTIISATKLSICVN